MGALHTLSKMESYSSRSCGFYSGLKHQRGLNVITHGCFFPATLKPMFSNGKWRIFVAFVTSIFVDLFVSDVLSLFFQQMLWIHVCLCWNSPAYEKRGRISLSTCINSRTGSLTLFLNVCSRPHALLSSQRSQCTPSSSTPLFHVSFSLFLCF